jgi:hypothetical protein
MTHQSLTPARGKCNKYDPTVYALFLMGRSEWLVKVVLRSAVSHIFAVLVLWVGLEKKYMTKLGCEVFL